MYGSNIVGKEILRKIYFEIEKLTPEEALAGILSNIFAYPTCLRNISPITTVYKVCAFFSYRENGGNAH